MRAAILESLLCISLGFGTDKYKAQHTAAVHYPSPVLSFPQQGLLVDDDDAGGCYNGQGQ